MTNTTEARVAPAAPSAELTEHVNVLMTREMRAFLLGSKIADDARGEGVVARALLGGAISDFAGRDGDEYRRRLQLGHDELERRAEQAAARQ